MALKQRVQKLEQSTGGRGEFERVVVRHGDEPLEDAIKRAGFDPESFNENEQGSRVIHVQHVSAEINRED